jgi:L-seryl-tRNA(Ser) seleniumtransferase
VLDGESTIWRRSAPGSVLPTALVALTHSSASARRASAPPLIARIEDDRVLLDLRTVAAEQDHELLQKFIAL